MLKSIVKVAPTLELAKECDRPSIVLGDDDFKSEDDVLVVTVPPKSLFREDLKQLDGFRDKRKAVKNKIEYDKFVEETKSVLLYFDYKKESKFDHQLCLFVMNLAENYFIYDVKMGKLKEDAVLELLLPYYENNDELLKSVVKLLMKDITKSTLRRRLSSRAVNFFCVVLSTLLKK